MPMFGVPEALLSDRGTNLLSHVMQDVCKLLGIRKLNTTAYHPQCDGMVERFNRTLKTILRKHAARFGNQWDRYLPGVLWAYRNTPHDATGEKPSFLLLGHDCRTPTEACYLPDTPTQVGSVEEYREELMISLTSARDLAAESIRKAQERYKRTYDRRATYTTTPLRSGDWVLVHMPQDEAGPLRKLPRCIADQGLFPSRQDSLVSEHVPHTSLVGFTGMGVSVVVLDGRLDGFQRC